MPKEVEPIFDVEAKRPVTNPLSEQEIKRREKEELSRPIEPQSREQIQKQYPDVKVKAGIFIVERDTDRFIFDKKGREIEHTSYRRLNPEKPSEFDIETRIQATYDEEGYLTTMTRMEIGKYGFIKYFNYENNDDGSRELHSIVSQPVMRQGLMEPGSAIGEPEIIDYSDIS